MSMKMPMKYNARSAQSAIVCIMICLASEMKHSAGAVETHAARETAIPQSRRSALIST